MFIPSTMDMNIVDPVLSTTPMKGDSYKQQLVTQLCLFTILQIYVYNYNYIYFLEIRLTKIGTVEIIPLLVD